MAAGTAGYANKRSGPRDRNPGPLWLIFPRRGVSRNLAPWVDGFLIKGTSNNGDFVVGSPAAVA